MSRNRRAPLRAMAVAAALAGWFPQQGAAQAPRQLGVHQHGHGTLHMAVEGKTLQAELEVPGADIVGFEHPATTDAEKKEMAAARKKLADPSALFAVPERAGCKLVSAEVALEGEEDSAKRHDDKRAAQAGEAIHSAFHAEYAFDCADVGAITQITFSYFRTFPNAQELDVTLITRKGQKTFDVKRETTRIDLRDLI